MVKTRIRNIEKIIAIGAVVIVIAGCLAYGARIIIELTLENSTLRKDDASHVSQLLQTEESSAKALSLAAQENARLTQELAATQSENNAVASQVQQLSGTVGTLTQLSQTDPQLLEKYSRVYFLNENYVPASLTDISSAYLYHPSSTQEFLTPALPFLNSMIAAAQSAGVTLQVVSGYRSFGTQTQLKSIYLVTYGSGANQFSAEQGYSEHQLGTAVDFTTPGTTALTLKFASSSAYAWLAANAYRYGFELSYPPKNPYYIFEPWHWRFVGIDLATYLHNNNITFYNADQRIIDSYLISIFNPQ